MSSQCLCSRGLNSLAGTRGQGYEEREWNVGNKRERQGVIERKSKRERNVKRGITSMRYEKVERDCRGDYSVQDADIWPKNMLSV